jgi:hypothetical protein
MQTHRKSRGIAMFAMAGAVLVAAAGVGEATGAVKAVQNSLRVNGIKAS